MATEVEFLEEVRMSLGGKCLVDVELDDDDIRLAFKKAKRTFKQQGHNNFRRRFIAIDVVKDTRNYTLPANTADVMRVVRPASTFSTDDVMNSVVYNELFSSYNMGGGSCGCGGGGTTGFDLLSYELTKQRIENMAMYSAQDVNFEYDRFTKEIIFLGSPKQEGKFFVDAYLDLTDDEYRDVDWIVRWSIAESRIVLGTAYEKFQSLPSPTGETTLGGSEMIARGESEKERLLEEILEFVDGDVDYMQITFG